MFSLSRTRTLATLAVGATVAVAAACGGSGSGYDGDAPTAPAPASPPPSTTAAPTVQATPQLAFTPREVTIGTGGTVTWAFGPVEHNVTFGAAAGAGSGSGEYGGSAGGTGSTSGGPANIPRSSNASVSRMFGAAGTYGYECTIHPGMTGTVTVR